MNAAFRNTDVRLEDREAIIRGAVANTSATPWRALDGWNIGYHLFDQPTSTLVVDGARSPMDLAPGAESEFEIRVAVPPEPGEYEIYASMMQEHTAWSYTQGWPFVLATVTVDDNGGAVLGRWQIATQSLLARRRLVRAVTRAFTLPLKSIATNRRLIGTLVRRDILSRYGGSFGGALWAILNPLLLILTYFFVFGVVLGDPHDRTGFVLYLLAGMLPWLAFSEGAGRSPNVLIEHRSFIRKLVFPVETLPVNLVATGLVTEFFGTLLFVAALLLIRHSIPVTALYLPLLLIPQVFFTAGVCWFLSALGVFIRDLAQINGFLLTIWFFITPICYRETSLASLPKPAVALLQLNPMYIYVQSYRRILLESSAPDWSALAWTTAVSLIVFFAGHAWFYKLRRSFADLI